MPDVNLLAGYGLVNESDTKQNLLSGYGIVNEGFSASPFVNIKTWNGIAVADIKTINGIAIADIKSLDGII